MNDPTLVIVGTNGVAFNNRIGQQRLFFARFGFIPGVTPALHPEARGLYFNRNRSYSPHLRRFMQKDVNETGLPILSRPRSSNDLTIVARAGRFNVREDQLQATSDDTPPEKVLLPSSRSESLGKVSAERAGGVQ